MAGDGYKYWAFISYSHRDRAWGDWLHKTLETYRVPARLAGRPSRDGEIPARLFPIFRDRDELPSSANLGDAISDSLRASRYQIVICSPRAAASRWVNEEVKYFKSLGRDDRVLCLIVDGEPNVFDVPGRDLEECFCPALRFRVTPAGEITTQPAEPIAADARDHADGRAGAKLKLIAGLIGVGLDELIQRERQRQLWKRVQTAATVLAFGGLCLGAWQWYVNETAAREREIAIEKLVDSGRRELLDGHEARAAVLLNRAYSMGHGTEALRFMLGQAMQAVESVTDVRVVHGGDEVYRAAFSHDGRQFALVASQDADPVHGGVETATLKTYDAATGRETVSLPQVPVLPLEIEFFDQGRHLLITGYPDSDQSGPPLTYIAALSPPAEIARLPGIHGLAGLALDPAGGRVLLNAESGIGVHDSRTGRRIGHWLRDATISASSFSADGTLVAAAQQQGPVHLLDGASGKRLRVLESDALDFAGVEFSRDGRRLFAFTRRGDVRLWDLESGRLHLGFAADRDWVNQIRLDGSGRRFATVGSEGYKVWSALRGSLILLVPAALNQYATADLSRDGDTLVTADYDNSVTQVWDVRSGRRLHSLDLHNGGISAAAFDDAGERLLLASRDGRAEIWRAPAKPAWTYDSFETYPYVARFDRAGRRLFVGAGDYTQGSVLIFDVASRDLLQRFEGHRAGLYDLRLSPAEDRVLTASRDGSAGLWDLRTGARLATLPHAPYEVAKAIYATDGRRILTIANPADIHRPDAASLWDADGRLIAGLAHAGGVIAAALGSRSLVTGGEDGLVKTWDADGQLRHTLRGHRAPVTAVAISPDDARILTGAADRSARLWDRSTGALERVFDDAALGLPSYAAFSHDNARAAIGTQEGKIFLWWPADQRTLTLKGHTQRITDLRFSVSDELLFSASADGTARAWDARSGLELAIVGWHAAPLNSLDLSPAGLLATVSYSRVQFTDVAPESRPPDAVDVILRCRTAWTMEPGASDLRPQIPEPCLRVR